jgi:hypothetical protein
MFPEINPILPDASREHRVPEQVILDMARRLEIPDVTETPLVEWVI